MKTIFGVIEVAVGGVGAGVSGLSLLLDNPIPSISAQYTFALFILFVLLAVSGGIIIGDNK